MQTRDLHHSCRVWHYTNTLPKGQRVSILFTEDQFVNGGNEFWRIRHSIKASREHQSGMLAVTDVYMTLHSSASLVVSTIVRNTKWPWP